MIYLIMSGAISIGLISALRRLEIVSGWWLTSALSLVCSGVVFISLLVGIPISRFNERENFARLQAFKDTVYRARQNKSLSEIERSAILTQIASWNEWLASRKYWNQDQWDYWHIDEVSTTEPLE